MSEERIQEAALAARILPEALGSAIALAEWDGVDQDDVGQIKSAFQALRGTHGFLFRPPPDIGAGARNHSGRPSMPVGWSRDRLSEAYAEIEADPRLEVRQRIARAAHGGGGD